ncbi:MAG: helix-turn-helix domain-containing protein, partial [bacterium]|nr:helix-turn-helix domain-containing protein [bacterium]
IEDSDGNLWIGTGNGLFRIQKEKNPTAAPATERLMTGSVVRTIFEDREKSIWIGTDGRGLARLRDGKIRTFSVESGLPHEYVVFMHEDRDKNLRVATMDGLVRFDNGRLHRDAMKIEFTDAVVGPICRGQQGNTWFGTYGSGLYVRLPNGRLVNYTISNGLRSDSIISLLSDSRGTLWVGTSRGLNVFENGRFKSYNDNARLLENEIYCIYEDNKHAVWIGTNKGLTVYRNGDFGQPGAGKLPPNSIISYIYQDGDGIFWIATKGNGLIRLEGENHVTTFTTRSGLNSNTIYQLFEDDDGYFWMSCDKGIFKVTRKSLNDLAASHTLPAAGTGVEPAQKIDYLYYGQSDGMKARECSRWGQHSSIKTSSGKLLFGTPKGISIIDPRNIKINKIPPSVLIQRVVVNNRALELDKKNDRFVFKTFDFIQFHFTASTLISPERTIFRYKLENHDTGWTPVKANQIKMAHYRKLEPGEYTFRVMAANSDGIWGEKGASFTFYYTPRFTGSPAFKIILGLLILLAGLLFFMLLKKYRRYLKSKSKYKDSALETEVVESCMKKLLYVMDIEKLYKDDKLSLQALAQKVSVTSHILSQVINEQLNKNFSDFVNSYRIEEAKKMLQDADEDTSILHICYEVGFNSKSAFYRAFKKFTDKTPSQYQKDLFNR